MRKITADRYQDFAIALCTEDAETLGQFNLSKHTIQVWKSYAKGSNTDRDLAREIYKGLNPTVLDYIDATIDQGYAETKALKYKVNKKQGPERFGHYGPRNKTVSQPIEPAATAPIKQLKLNFKPVKEEKCMSEKFSKSDVMSIVKQMYEVTMEALRKI